MSDIPPVKSFEVRLNIHHYFSYALKTYISQCVDGSKGDSYQLVDNYNNSLSRNPLPFIDLIYKAIHEGLQTEHEDCYSSAIGLMLGEIKEGIYHQNIVWCRPAVVKQNGMLFFIFAYTVLVFSSNYKHNR